MNEKGSLYPMTLFLVALSLLIATGSISLLLRHQSFYEDTNEYYNLKNLTLVALQHSLAHLQDGTTKTFHTPNGTVSYTVNNVTDDLFDVSVLCITENQTSYAFTYQYNQLNHEIVNWITLQ